MGKVTKIFEGGSLLCQCGKSLTFKSDVLPDYHYYFILAYNSLYKFKDGAVEEDEKKKKKVGHDFSDMKRPSYTFSKGITFLHTTRAIFV